MNELPLQDNSKRSQIYRAIGTVAALGLVVYLLSQQGWEDIWNAIRQIPIWRIAMAMLLMVISRFSVTGRWYTLLQSSGVDISLAQTLRITFAGLFASNFLPTTIGGDVVRLAGILQVKSDAAVSAASLIVDRLVGMAGMVMAVPFGLPTFLSAGILQGLLSKEQSFRQTGLALASISGLWRKVWNRGLRIVNRLLAALSLWLKKPAALLISLAFTWIHMLCLFGVLYLLYGGMNEGISFWLIGGLYSIVYFITLVPISINGYGLQELSMTFVFVQLGGTSLSSGLTAALLFRTMMMTASLPGVFFLPEILPRLKKRQKQSST